MYVTNCEYHSHGDHLIRSKKHMIKFRVIGIWEEATIGGAAGARGAQPVAAVTCTFARAAASFDFAPPVITTNN